MIEQALADAGVAPSDVDLVEAHGTGTELGDPIEVRALDAVYSRQRPADSPLLLGSAKTNLGHLEAAAGVAGLLKVVLALQHAEIPPHLHCDELTPHVDWASMPIEVTTEGRAWPHAERPRRAAISAFGFSGTNAHVILEEAPPAAPPSPAVRAGDEPVELLTLSARDEAGLVELANRYADHLEAVAAPIGGVAWTAQTGRAGFAHRLVVPGRTSGETAAQLRAWLAGDAPAGVLHGEAAPGGRPQLAFVFTGQGAQHPGMGRSLYAREPVFRAAMDECDRILRPHLPRPLLEVLYAGEAEEPGVAELVHHTAFTQPALFALEYSLSQLWRSWGIVPSAVVGHSIGEYAAACVAGVMGLEDALALIAARGRLMGELPAGGAMVATFADEARVRELIEPYRAHVGLAASNGPSNVVISGEGDAIDAIVEQLVDAGIGHRRLPVSHAFHSPCMAPMLEAFTAVAASVQYHRPTVPFVSTVTGSLETEAITTADYWREHVQATVRFAAAVTELQAAGVDQLLEIGPQPTLLGMVARLEGGPRGLHASLRPGRDDSEQMAEALGGLWVAGLSPSWDAVHHDTPATVDAPTYPFQRQRYWFEPGATRREPTGPTLHPLVHRAIDSPAIAGGAYESRLGADDPAYLDDHRLFHAPLMPAAGFLEMVLAAAQDVFGQQPLALEQVSFHEALALVPGARQDLQVTLSAPIDGTAEARRLQSRRGWLATPRHRGAARRVPGRASRALRSHRPASQGRRRDGGGGVLRAHRQRGPDLRSGLPHHRARGLGRRLGVRPPDHPARLADERRGLPPASCAPGWRGPAGRRRADDRRRSRRGRVHPGRPGQLPELRAGRRDGVGRRAGGLAVPGRVPAQQ